MNSPKQPPESVPPTTSKSIQAAIFDLGDVLFTWTLPSSDLPINRKMLRRMLNTATWFQYEIGLLLETEVCASLSQEFQIPADMINSVLELTRQSLRSDPSMWNMVRELKKSGITCYAMSNVSVWNWEFLRTTVNSDDWNMFERVFTS